MLTNIISPLKEDRIIPEYIEEGNIKIKISMPANINWCDRNYTYRSTMSFGTTLYTWFYGKLVGFDEIGINITLIAITADLNAKRWVIFNGKIEASKYPHTGMHGHK